MVFRKHNGSLKWQLKGFVALGVLEIALLQGMSVAHADIITIDDPHVVDSEDIIVDVTSPVTITNNTDTGNIITIGSGVYGDGNTVSNAGTVDVNSTNNNDIDDNYITIGVGVAGDGNTVSNAGTVDVNSTNNNDIDENYITMGIGVAGDGNTVNNTDTVNVTSVNDGNIIGNSLTVGIAAVGDNSTVNNDNSVTVNSTNSAGNHTHFYDTIGIGVVGENATVNNNNSVTVESMNEGTEWEDYFTSGINVEGDGATVNNDGTVDVTSMNNGNVADDHYFTTGIDVIGEEARVGNAISVTVDSLNDGEVDDDYTTYGINVDGDRAVVSNTGIVDVISTNNGTAEHYKTYGINVAGDGAEVSNTNSVTVDSLNDFYLYDDYRTFGINVDGDRAVVSNTSIVDVISTNSGTADQYKTYGIKVDGDGAEVSNTNSVTVDSLNDGFLDDDYRTFGIRVKAADAEINNDGLLSVTSVNDGYVDNDYSTIGIRVSGYDGGTVNNSDLIAVTSTNDDTVDGDYETYGIKVRTDDDAKVWNSGTINVTSTNNGFVVGEYDYDTIGIEVSSDYNDFTNHGSVSVTSTNAGVVTDDYDTIGIEVYGDNNLITNSGLVTVHSTNNGNVGENYFTAGVYINGYDNMFANTGSVFANLGDDSAAIYVDDDDNTVELMNRSIIQGRIVFDDTDEDSGNTLKIGDGYDALFTITADDLREVDINGEGQLMLVDYNTNRVLSLGGRAAQIAASSQVTTDLARTLHQTIEDRQARNLAVGADQGMGAWMNANLYGRDNNDSTGSSSVTGTLTFGIDGVLDENSSAGFYGGYANSRVDAANNIWENQIQTFYAGSYYSRMTGNLLTGIDFLSGINWNDSTSEFSDNTVLGGIAEDSSNSTGFFASPSVTLGYSYQFGDTLVTPSMTGSYTFVSYGDSDQHGVSFSSQNSHQFNLRTQMAVAKSGENWFARLRTGVDLYSNSGNDIDVEWAGLSGSLDGLENETGARPFVGGDFTYNFNEKLQADLGFEAAYDSEEQVSGNGRLGLSMKF